MAGEGHVLLVAPMPLWPASAGNRRRALEVAQLLKANGFSVHIAVTDHEDQIYRAFGQTPPNDLGYLVSAFDEVFYVDSPAAARIRTAADIFFVDDWFPETLDDFTAWYLNAYGPPRAVLANYVFYSKLLAAFPKETLKIVDAHDRFAGRNKTNRIGRAEPNFFYTSESEEAKGLGRADLVLAIQEVEAEKLRGYVTCKVSTLGHRAAERSSPTPGGALKRFGFIGHGNDANIASIDKFAKEWAARFPNAGPTLVVAGEVSNTVALGLSNVEIMGYVENVVDFYDSVDAVVAPILFGTGLKIKVVEALAQDKIVIGTRVAFDGLSASANLHCLNSGAEIFDCILAIKDSNTEVGEAHAASRELYRRYRAAVDAQERAFLDQIRAAVPSTSCGGVGVGVAVPARRIETTVEEHKIVVEIGPLMTGRHRDHAQSPGILIAIETAYAQDHIANASAPFTPTRAHVYLADNKSCGMERAGETLDTTKLVAFLAAKRFLPYLTRSTLDAVKRNRAVLEIFAAILFSSKAWWSVGNLDFRDGGAVLLAHLPVQMLMADAQNSLVLLEYRCTEHETRWVAARQVRCAAVSDVAAMASFGSLPENYRSAGCESLVPARLQIQIDGRETIPHHVTEWRLYGKVGPIAGLVSSKLRWDDAKPSDGGRQRLLG